MEVKGFSTLERKKIYSLERCWFSTNCQYNTDLVRYLRVEKPHKGLCVQNDPLKTVCTDLNDPEDVILAKATKTIKYEVNKCLKEDVTTDFFPSQKGGVVDKSIIDEFEKQYIDFATGLNNQEVLNAYKRYNVDVLANSGHLLISRATAPGTFVYHVYAWGGKSSCLIFSISNFRAESSLRNLTGRMNKMLHIVDMRWFRDNGVELYDWGNISRSGKQVGIDQFKVSFGGDVYDLFNVTEAKTLKGKVLIICRKLWRGFKYV